MLVTGMTPAADFPMVNPIQNNQPGFDAFVAKISADGQTLLYATYLGGAGSDEGAGIVTDAGGAAYMVGETGSNDFPTVNPLQPAYGGFISDAFVARFTASGAAVYATYLGGANSDRGNAVAANSDGEAYVTGCTASNNFPIVNPLRTFSGIIGCAVFVSRLDNDGAALRYSTLLGGGEDNGIAWARGYAYVGGEAGNALLIERPLKATPMGRGEAFVSQINDRDYIYLPMLSRR